MKLINLEDIFSNIVEPPAVVLVEGQAGTLKSALCFSTMLDILKNPDDSGLYLTFEQTWESHLRNMNSLGMEARENLMPLDYNIMRKETGINERDINIFDSITNILESVKTEKKEGFKIFALDSLNALYSITDEKALPYVIMPFFKKLRELDLISLIIFEKSVDKPDSCYREKFLADGIISLGLQKEMGEVSRFLQVLKYSKAAHSLKRKNLIASSKGLSLLGTVYR
ncbi:MAG: RAD55 family ATPase [Vulcanimicrobiota bacterium]